MLRGERRDSRALDHGCENYQEFFLSTTPQQKAIYSYTEQYYIVRDISGVCVCVCDLVRDSPNPSFVKKKNSK